MYQYFSTEYYNFLNQRQFTDIHAYQCVHRNLLVLLIILFLEITILKRKKIFNRLLCTRYLITFVLVVDTFSLNLLYLCEKHFCKRIDCFDKLLIFMTYYINLDERRWIELYCHFYFCWIFPLLFFKWQIFCDCYAK